MICLYHLDDDGKCAAAMVNKFGRHDSWPDKFIEMNYGFDVPFDKITADEMVYIVDFSIKPQDMLKLLNDFTLNVVWIDHHQSAIDMYDGFPQKIQGIRSNKYSGCMLTYLYLTNHIDLLDKPYSAMVNDAKVPLIVQLCDDYDMWRFRIDITKSFHEGFAIIPHEPTDCIWRDFTWQAMGKISDSGKAIIRYRADMMSNLIKSYGYESICDGHRCFVLNQGIISSNDFETVAANYDFLIGFIWDGEKYSYSLRSTDGGPDVCEIAKKYGGGGHIHAAGCHSEKMLLPKVAKT